MVLSKGSQKEFLQVNTMKGGSTNRGTKGCLVLVLHRHPSSPLKSTCKNKSEKEPTILRGRVKQRGQKLIWPKPHRSYYRKISFFRRNSNPFTFMRVIYPCKCENSRIKFVHIIKNTKSIWYWKVTQETWVSTVTKTANMWVRLVGKDAGLTQGKTFKTNI